MKKYYLLFLIFFTVTALSANEIVISFQPKDNTETIDSIHATNLTKGQTVKLSSGESLKIASATSSDLIKISDIGEGYLYPNPSEGYTTLSFNTAKSEKVFLAIYDMTGKMMINKIHSLNQGVHKFHLRFPTPGLYHVTVLTNEGTLSYKAVYSGSDQQSSEIEYLSSNQITADNSQLKSAHTEKTLDYSEGDVIHYTVYSGDNTTVIADAPTTSKTLEVEFFECIDHEKGNYKIVQIGNQWWMAENLAYLPAVSPELTGSETTKHYYVYDYNGTDVDAAKATYNYRTYGVLYNWPAAMDGAGSSSANPSGVQGVCPAGWHLPSDAEWTQLENYLIDNVYNYDPTIGDDKIAKSLAANILWNTSSYTGAIGNNLSANNRSGFSGLPGAYRDYYGFFYVIGHYGYWWSSNTEYSTEYSTTYAWYWRLYYDRSSVIRHYHIKEAGFSVRCLRD